MADPTPTDWELDVARVRCPMGAEIPPTCACGHVDDEHEQTGFQRCAVDDCPCIAFDPEPQEGWSDG